MRIPQASNRSCRSGSEIYVNGAGVKSSARGVLCVGGNSSLRAKSLKKEGEGQNFQLKRRSRMR